MTAPTKKKLTIADAAEQWEAAKREIAVQNALVAEAAPVLLAHLEKTGRMTYRDRIRRKATGGALVLDTDAVKEFLGAAVAKYQKRQKSGWALELLEK